MYKTEEGFVLIKNHQEWDAFSRKFVGMRAPDHYPCYVLMVEYGVVITRWQPHFLYAPEADRLIRAAPHGEFYRQQAESEETYEEVFDRLENTICNL